VSGSTYLFYLLFIARFGIVRCLLSNDDRSQNLTVRCDATTPCADQVGIWESITSPGYGSREKDEIRAFLQSAGGLDPMVACPSDLLNSNNDVNQIERQVSRHRRLRPRPLLLFMDFNVSGKSCETR
jgi:hypothetical protein